MFAELDVDAAGFPVYESPELRQIFMSYKVPKVDQSF